MSFFLKYFLCLTWAWGLILAGIIKSTEGTVKYSQAPLPTSLISRVSEWSQGEMRTRVALSDGMDASLDGRPLPRPTSATGSSRLPLRHAGWGSSWGRWPLKHPDRILGKKKKAFSLSKHFLYSEKGAQNAMQLAPRKSGYSAER